MPSRQLIDDRIEPAKPATYRNSRPGSFASLGGWTAIVLAVGLGVAATGVTALRADDGVAKDAGSGANGDQEESRFDELVREDIFAGFNGDDVALKRGIASCDAVLAKQPNHAEAMVWRGAARVYQAGQAFAKQDANTGMPLWTSGLKDMDRAVELEPDNLGVRIPRAAVLMPSANGAPEFMAKPLLAKAKADFEKVYEAQKSILDQIGEHPLGELRMGLADVYRRLGEHQKSTAQLNAVKLELPDSQYAQEATKWLATDVSVKLSHNCIGCHSE